jgi:ABC-type siderophore export system fused ATPase/permease subunit
MSYHAIQASEISEYVYCRKSWQLNRDGHHSVDVSRYVPGTEYHREHHQKVRKSNMLSKIALLMLFAAIGLATFWLVWSL